MCNGNVDYMSYAQVFQCNSLESDSSASNITSLQAGWPGNQDSVTIKSIEFLQSAQTYSGVHLACSPVGAWDLLLGANWPWCNTDSCLPSSAEVNSVWSSTFTPTCLSTYFSAKLSVGINLHWTCNNFLLQSCTVIMLLYSDILCDTLALNITVEWLPLLHMWENLRSNLRATIGWPLTFVVVFFSCFRQMVGWQHKQVYDHWLETASPIDCSLWFY